MSMGTDGGEIKEPVTRWSLTIDLIGNLGTDILEYLPLK